MLYYDYETYKINVALKTEKIKKHYFYCTLKMDTCEKYGKKK